jgi:anti-sigma B factor antagonist
MPQATAQSLHVRRRLGGVAIVSFASPYLQTEDAIIKVGEELADLVEHQGFNKLVITFEGVRFASSSMLAQIFKLHKQVTKAKGWLKLCKLTPTLQDVLRASQLDKLLSVYEDEDAALAKS